MYAVIKTGGKQYRVAVGDKFKVESLSADIGETVSFDEVMMVADGDKVEVGTPLLSTTVQARVLAHGRGDKLRILKFRRRQNSRTRGGHRQNYTFVEVTGIGGKAPAKKAAAKKAEPKVEKVPAKKAPAKKAAAKKTEGADDLTKISGIGPVIVGKLNDMGITTFDQIAKLKKADIVEIDEKLNFKGRIERDEWIKQAKELAKG